MRDTLQQLVMQYATSADIIDTYGYVHEIDAFCRYDIDHRVWRILSDKRMKEDVFHWLHKNTDRDIVPSLIANFLELLQYLIPRKFNTAITPYVSFLDQVFCLKTFTLVDNPSPDTPSFMYVNCKFSECMMDTPLFDSFLSEILVDEKGEPDEALKNYIIQIFGYSLLPTTDAQAMFFFTGKGNNGKSVLLSIMEAMFPGEFVTHLSIEKLTTDRFVGNELVGKRINILNEEESKYIKADKFKALVDGLAFYTDRKFKEGINFKPTCKFFYATNKPPTFEDLDYSLLRRINIVDFNYHIPDEKKNPNLKYAIIGQELPGIIGKAIFQGAYLLLKNNLQFTVPGTVVKSKMRYERKANPIVAYLESRYEYDMNSFVSYQDMYKGYEYWSTEVGRKKYNELNFRQQVAYVFSLATTVEQYVPEVGRIQAGLHLREKESYDPYGTIL